jgi:hypothetical protein
MKFIPGKLYKVIRRFSILSKEHLLIDNQYIIEPETILLLVKTRDAQHRSGSYQELVFLYNSKLVVANSFEIDENPRYYFEEVEL